MDISSKENSTKKGPLLRISEIFYSIQGESSRAGWPTVFIRLTGCPLRCHYCDTTHAFKGGKRLTLSDILEKVKSYPTRYITVTGGEPLSQPDCLALLTLLCDHDYYVSLETSGALSIEKVDSRVMNILDLKTPSSGECEKNLYSNLSFLKPSDQIKFVVGNREDFDWACQIISNYQLEKIAEVLFSPVWETLAPNFLADWLLESGLNARLQVQLHKILWGENTRR